MKYLLTVDPGAEGAWVLRNLATSALGYDLISSHPFKDELFSAGSLRAIDEEFGLGSIAVVIENVHASPVMSQSSAFSFGRNVGIWIGLFAAHSKEVRGVSPSQWQTLWADRLDGVQGSKRKSELNRIAKELYPSTHVTLTNCDALLISHYCINHHKTKGELPGKFI